MKILKVFNNSNKRTVTLIALALSVLMALCLMAGCSNTDTPAQGSETGEAAPTGAATGYSVTVNSSGGNALSGLDVYIYDSAELSNMVDFAKTDEEGKVSFSIAENDKYAIVIASAPDGYTVEKSYSFNGKNADIVLQSGLITDEDISTATLGLGDMMYDFTVTTTEGEEFTLSEVLKEKKMVLLNFWYTTCTWCVEEFPLMNEVYQEYKDDIEIIALDPLDAEEDVKTFKEQYQLTFPMAACPSSWANTFGISGYPTSIIVDREGVICVVEAGAVTSKRPFVCAFDHFVAEDYEQKICEGGIGDLVTQIKPTFEMDTSENVAAIMNNGNVEVTYRPETEDENAEFFWPFVATEANGKKCLYASNKGIDDSYAIMYADVTLKAGQAVGFDYIASSESLCDIMYVIVDDQDVFQISGVSEKPEWSSCYPIVAEEDGTYELALCYLKDSDGADGDDTVYVSNLRIVDAADIDVDTYLPRQAAKETDEGYDYATVVYNEADGYYHVGTENGPLLLADLMGYTVFSEEESIYTMVFEGNADKDGVSLYNKTEEGGLGMVTYFSYASNSALNGVCTVNKELAEMLQQVAEVAGFNADDKNEWLQMCRYYEAFGPDGTQLEDPIKGLATFSAYTATVGKDVPTNYFFYDRAIMPRGTFAKFVPDTTGVYRFTSKSDYEEGIEAWVFDENMEMAYTYEHIERMFSDNSNCSIVYFMEAGKTYYINMAFWDIYHVGYIYYDVEYLGASYDLFSAASKGYFTYDETASGEMMYDIVDGGIKVELKDGKYYAEGTDKLIYADFTGITNIFDQSIEDMIDMGGFDFSKSETDMEILSYFEKNGKDVDKTEQFLKDLWGEDYEASAEAYMIEDVFEGRYHGEGDDLTEEMRGYLAKIDNSGTECDGCVVVDERLAEILQLLMDKYTFEDVENSWLKVCYYYNTIG